MATLWVISDQDPKKTGRFYEALAHKLLREVFVDRPPRVRLALVGRGREGFPLRYAQEAAGRIQNDRRGSPREDRIVLVVDSEGEEPEDTRRHLAEAGQALAKELGIKPDQIHVVVIIPMTEAVYFLDEAMVRCVAAQARPGGKAPRRRRRPANLEQLGRRRRAYAVGLGPPPSKAELNEALGSFDKGTLAHQAAAVIREMDGLPSSTEIDRIIEFLRAWADSP